MQMILYLVSAPIVLIPVDRLPVRQQKPPAFADTHAGNDMQADWLNTRR